MHHFQKVLLILLLIISSNLQATDLYPITDKRADTFEMAHTHLELNCTNIGNRVLAARADIKLKSKLNGVEKVTLDLESLNVDSIKCGSIACSFSQGIQKVSVNLPSALALGDSIIVSVYYSGTPKTDVSGFGGFYFTNEYAYAIGVGFRADPHPFGRSWFPCFDNFVMKGTYSFKVTTDTGFVAVCGGELISETTAGAVSVWEYYLHQPIPSYLASLGVSKYELKQGNMNTVQGNIPYILAAMERDTQELTASFANFKGAVDAFIAYYGLYRWDRLGYHLVPFNGGAMEHACNISYPLFAVDGSLDREDLMAHELAHHWWGNNVTCKTQEDMWINEGWASYSEKLFNEFVYGKAKYRSKVAETHRDVLQFAHIADGEILPVSGIGHDHTYGRHVYRKGADVAHTLRGYMGDTAFFRGIKHIMDSKQFGNMDSKELIDSFQKFTPIDLSSFYNGWVIGKGFPHLAIKTWDSKPVGNQFRVNVGVLQRNRWDGTPHELIPVDLNFLRSDFTWSTKQVLATKFQSNFEVLLDFDPVWVGIDLDAKLSDATSDTFRTITSTGTYAFEDGKMEVKVNAISQPAFVKITHNWIGANTDTKTELLPILSKDRYWTVAGVFPPNFEATATLTYSGRTNGLVGDNFLDHQLIIGLEDSVELMYRPDMFSPWTLADATKEMGISRLDRAGSFTINNLKPGEYALAMHKLSLANPTPSQNHSAVQIYPNPTKGLVHIDFLSFAEPGYIIITDSTGKVILRKAIRNTQNNLDIDTKNWTAGTYGLLLQYPSGETGRASFTVSK